VFNAAARAHSARLFMHTATCKLFANHDRTPVVRGIWNDLSQVDAMELIKHVGSFVGTYFENVRCQELDGMEWQRLPRTIESM